MRSRSICTILLVVFAVTAGVFTVYQRRSHLDVSVASMQGSSSQITPRSGVADYRSGTGICELHDVKMRTIELPIVYGLLSEERTDFLVARLNQFPNTYDSAVPGGCIVEPEQSALVYVCPVCEQVQDKWVATWNREHGWDQYFPTAR